ncbi:hypothetical protein BC827DRAFT_1271133 [Russula dissimulans]|nr:hypothetical protein BC827DRAFT_1271133 [Russula dissimulans]
MAARCSLHSTELVLPSVPRIGIPPTAAHIVDQQHESPLNLLQIENDSDLITMDFFHSHHLTQQLIGHAPASTGNYIASPVPSSEDAATNPVRLPLPPSSSSSPLPSSSPHNHRIPRACNGVERRKRSHPSPPSGADYQRLAKLTRTGRAAIKTASSRRVSFAEHAHQIASSSLWTAPADGAPRATTTTTTFLVNGKPKRHRHRRCRTPTPTPTLTPTPVPRATRLSLELERASLGGHSGHHHRGNTSPSPSPGFDGDVDEYGYGYEYDYGSEQPAASANWKVARRREMMAHVGAKERLTITVPGGKSEAYVAMAFERSCSHGDEENDDGDASAVHHYPVLPSIPPHEHEQQQQQQLRLVPEAEKTCMVDDAKGKKTGLKIKIPVPNPLFMLSLHMASSCHISEDAASAEYPGAGAGAGAAATHIDRPESGPGYSRPSTPWATSYLSPADDNDDNNNNTMMMVTTTTTTSPVQIQIQDHNPNPVPPLVAQIDGTAALSRSPTPIPTPAAPPPSPTLIPEGRAERRVARRAVLAPYYALDRLRASSLNKRSSLVPS